MTEMNSDLINHDLIAEIEADTIRYREMRLMAARKRFDRVSKLEEKVTQLGIKNFKLEQTISELEEMIVQLKRGAAL